MSRNAESHFSENPVTLDIQRSRFKRPFDHKFTFNEGDLIPFYVDEVLPGDTAKVKLSCLVRMSTPIFPVMDNAWLDTYFFFIPYRLVWANFKKFMGEQEPANWAAPVQYTVPQTTAPVNGWNAKTIADYMGIPTKVDNISISSLPGRCYGLVYNEWFRSENLIDSQYVSTSDANDIGANTSQSPVNSSRQYAQPLKVGRLPDYFSSALPSPQKGPDVFVNLGGQAPLKFAEPTYVRSGETEQTNLRGKEVGGIGSYYDGSPDHLEGLWWAKDGTELTVPGKATNIVADLSQSTGMTINELRQAFAIQRMYEKDARGGTRYRELIRTHFSVTVPDYRVQVPEYLGGKRVPINMTQVVQTSATGSTSPQGNTSAYSLTIDNQGMFTKSFQEHGLILGLCCVRVNRTYQQGIERFWSRLDREDFYFPSLANIGEQGIKLKELYAQGTSDDETIFGYQEAWAEYRYKPSRVSGEFRSNYTTPLDTWHYADYYSQKPVLGQAWFEESKTQVQRTLAIQTQDQFLADFYVDGTWTRPMPLYSVPGLIDHH